MKPRHIALLFAIAAAVRGADALESGESDGPDEILGRFRLYALQHGDLGRIDPERRLGAVRQEVERRRAARAEKHLLGIGGSRWVSLGPTNGAGRMTAVAPHPTIAGTVYAGAAGGGVWKTEDGGTTWSPLTEDLPDLSVGALAIAPSAPDTIYLGTGEGGFGGFIPGIGLLTSRDAGATWSLPETIVARSFFRISVHPSRPDELFAGTENGGGRSTDGGRTFTFSIPARTYGLVTEVLRTPGAAEVLYAATWCANGCSQGVARVLKSTDGGVTWVSKSLGLPDDVDDPFTERLSLAMSPSDPRVMYAATSLPNAGGRLLAHVYKTTDGGDTWSDLPSVHGNSDGDVASYFNLQSWYDNALVVAPGDPNTVLAGGVLAIRTTDGGATWRANRQLDFHVDQHDFQYQGSTLWIANDGGIFASSDRGATMTPRNDGLVTRQYYALGNDLAHRNRIVAGSQDNGTGQRPDAGGDEWRNILGADGFECAASPQAPNLLYATVQNGGIFRSRDAGAARITFSRITPPYDAGETRPFRTVFALVPGTPTTIYTGSWRIWRSSDAGDTWVPLPAETAAGTPWNPFEPVSAIAVAPSAPNVVWVAAGRLAYRSSDSGRTWQEASAGLPQARVNGLEVDPADPNAAYAAIATTVGPAVYRTTDRGAHWEARASGLPASFAAIVVRVDPTDRDVLFCGTDVGVFRSTDRGAAWSRFGTNLPAVSVHDLEISGDGSLARIATHGRGVWELELPPPGNRPPLVTLISPSAAVRRSVGETVEFTGRLADEDAGDAVTGTWTFPDTWETASIGRGESTISHAFRRAGVFPVSLTAVDESGATASTFVTVTVPEAADDCAQPAPLPGAGPFPATVLVNNESATPQPDDPAPACTFEGTGVFGSVWLELRPASTDFYEISTCGAMADTVLTAFTGPSCGALEVLANGCNDDTPRNDDGACARTSSLLTLFVEAGQTVRLQLTGYFPDEVSTVPVTVRLSSGRDAPQVTGITSRVAPGNGGTEVFLTGARFGEGARVRFGGVEATDLQRIGPSLVSVVTPPHAAGPVEVSVENPDGSSGRLIGAFTYLASAPPRNLCPDGSDCPSRPRTHVVRPRR
jgi:photosystem II stability/assembly factor-like uncharacterized protein